MLPAVAAPQRARSRCLRTRLDREMTRPMVWLALVFVVVMAAALPHAYLSISGDDTAPLETGTLQSGPLAPSEKLAIINNLAVGLLVLLALPFWIEALLRLAYIEHGEGVPRPSRGRAAYILCCALVPPLRTGLHPASMRGHMWLPIFGWRRTSLRLSRRVQKAFGVPMLLIGLLILPVLVGEIFFSRQVQASAGLALGMDAATRLIWFAFALEFIVMMAVTPRRTEYALRHWVDLVIILLPFVAFLRSLQVLRAGQVLKAQRMSQFARVYRLRGVAVKLLQAVLMLRVLEGMSERAARRRIKGIRAHISYREAEIKDLHLELRDLRRELAAKKRRQLEKRRQKRARAIAIARTASAARDDAGPHTDAPPHDQARRRVR